VILQTDNDKVQADQDIAEKDGKYYKTGGGNEFYLCSKFVIIKIEKK